MDLVHDEKVFAVRPITRPTLPVIALLWVVGLGGQVAYLAWIGSW
jgi:hypothetical protein